MDLLKLAATIPVSFVALMPVINPVGTAIILQSFTSDVDPRTRRVIGKQIAINTVGLLSAVLLGGHYLLQFFGVSVPIVQLAGGAVVVSMGWRWLNQDSPGEKKESGTDPEAQSASPLSKTFYPFTFPMTVGPGSIAVALTLSAHTMHDSYLDTIAIQIGALIGVIGIAVLTYLCYVYSSRLTSRLGPTGTSVLLRLMAFLVVCIGAEISWTGIKALLESLPRT